MFSFWQATGFQLVPNVCLFWSIRFTFIEHDGSCLVKIKNCPPFERIWFHPRFDGSMWCSYIVCLSYFLFFLPFWLILFTLTFQHCGMFYWRYLSYSIIIMQYAKTFLNALANKIIVKVSKLLLSWWNFRSKFNKYL